MRLYPVAPLIARDLHSEAQIGECEREHALARLHVAREIARTRLRSKQLLWSETLS
jgi:hypothetical protein